MTTSAPKYKVRPLVEVVAGRPARLKLNVVDIALLFVRGEPVITPNARTCCPLLSPELMRPEPQPLVADPCCQEEPGGMVKSPQAVVPPNPQKLKSASPYPEVVIADINCELVDACQEDTVGPLATKVPLELVVPGVNSWAPLYRPRLTGVDPAPPAAVT